MGKPTYKEAFLNPQLSLVAKVELVNNMFNHILVLGVASHGIDNLIERQYPHEADFIAASTVMQEVINKLKT